MRRWVWVWVALGCGGDAPDHPHPDMCKELVGHLSQLKLDEAMRFSPSPSLPKKSVTDEQVRACVAGKSWTQKQYLCALSKNKHAEAMACRK